MPNCLPPDSIRLLWQLVYEFVVQMQEPAPKPSIDGQELFRGFLHSCSPPETICWSVWAAKSQRPKEKTAHELHGAAEPQPRVNTDRCSSVFICGFIFVQSMQTTFLGRLRRISGSLFHRSLTCAARTQAHENAVQPSRGMAKQWRS